MFYLKVRPTKAFVYLCSRGMLSGPAKVETALYVSVFPPKVHGYIHSSRVFIYWQTIPNNKVDNNIFCLFLTYETLIYEAVENVFCCPLILI